MLSTTPEHNGTSTPELTSTFTTKILAIVVLYKTKLEESVSIKTLIQARDAVHPLKCDLSIVIADNTPGGQDVSTLPQGSSYMSFPENPGLTVPYNLAIAQADREGHEWLLTLDQDTDLPATFITSMLQYLQKYGSDEGIAAVVPRVSDNGVPISPFRFVSGWLPVVLKAGVDGVSKLHTSAINSGSMIRLSALKDVGGYDDRFPLNNSDTALFHRLDTSGYRIVVAGDVAVQHELAIMRRSDRMTAQRYRQLLIDEGDFWRLHMSFPGRLERLFRLAGRFCKGVLNREDPKFQRITLAEIGRRLFSR